ncbi:unnamed protein product [Sphagnum balticum]
MNLTHTTLGFKALCSPPMYMLRKNLVFPGCVCATAAFSESSHNEEVKESSGSDKLRDWLQQNAQKRRQPVGERVLRMVAAASAAPVAQYIASPVTPLHTLDPRVKQAWLLALVVLPSRSHISIRMGVIAILVVITIWGLPHHVWQDQLGRMAILSAFLFVMLALGTDGVPSLVQTRTPPPLTQGLPKLPAALGGYKYVLMKLGPLQLTRKGVALAASASCLSFTVLQSASVCLATTTPEQLALALRWGIAPFAHIGAPVDELILTLLLSLRFIGLVFDEVRNIAMGVVARGIEWRSLRLTETADAFFTLFGRLFKNLFNHADQISQAMVARGYKGDPAKHHIYFLTKLSIKASDWVAIGGLLVLLVLSIWSEIMLPV